MPKVGKKKYPYTPKGMAAAKKASKKNWEKNDQKEVLVWQTENLKN